MRAKVHFSDPFDPKTFPLDSKVFRQGAVNFPSACGVPDSLHLKDPAYFLSISEHVVKQ